MPLSVAALQPTLHDLFTDTAAAVPGRGGRHCRHGQAAALKLVLEAEVSAGAFTDVSLLAGLDNDKAAAVAGKPLPAGALLLEDLGFFSGERLQDCIDQGVYVLTRVQAWTAVFDPAGRRLDLVKLLRRQVGDSLDLPVRILHGAKAAVRRLAARRVRRRALALLGALGRVEALAGVVARLAVLLHRRCRVVRRRAAPSTLDRLTALDPEFDQTQADPSREAA